MRFNWSLRIAMVSVTALLALGAARADTDPAKTYQEILQWRTQQIQEARDSKQTVDLSAIVKAATAKAKAAVEGVDPAKVEPAKGLEWARLFELAQQPVGVAAAAGRFLTTNPDAAAKFTAQMMQVSAYEEREDGAKLNRLLNSITPPDKAAALRLALNAGNCADTISDTVNARTALKLLQSIETRTPWTEYTADREKATADAAKFNLATTRAEILGSSHRTAEALAVLTDVKAHLDAKSRYLPQVDAQIVATKLVHAPAPAIVRERGYGDFPGLSAYKGKIVLIDFMAHWCGPCKQSLPSMQKLYNDYHSQGLEIVSVTQFYGFLGKEKKLTPDEEFTRMDGFLKDEGMTWPVAFGPHANSESYGVAGIPNFILIDKSGKVDSVTIGYSPARFARLRKSVESLLGTEAGTE